MTRLRPPSVGADPANDLARHTFGQEGVSLPWEIRHDLDRQARASPSTRPVRPILSGSWLDAECTAGRNLARILHELGLLDDRTEG